MSNRNRVQFLALIAMCCGAASCGNSSTEQPPGGSPQQPGTQPTYDKVYTGDGTYYGATGDGNCSFGPSPNDLDVAAMNDPQYANSSACGMCVEVTGPRGKIVVRIVDRCPECKTGDLDLSESAFAKIANPVDGRVKISWQPVACSVSGPVSYRFKEGSSEYWMAVQVRNSRYPIAKIELQQGGSFLTLKQQNYNYYVQDSPAPGKGPFSFRVTATGGQQLTDSGIVLSPAQIVTGSQQF